METIIVWDICIRLQDWKTPEVFHIDNVGVEDPSELKPLPEIWIWDRLLNEEEAVSFKYPKKEYCKKCKKEKTYRYSDLTGSKVSKLYCGCALYPIDWSNL